jgi:parvulin-like peptidyl-prolyl isomerase
MAILVLALGVGSARAEVVEEIVAWVDGDIITKSELEDEEQLVTEEVYRRYAGAELDEQLAAIRTRLLPELIDRKILLHRAARLFDLDNLGGMLVEDFRDRNELDSDEELKRALASQGMTVEDLKRRLLESMAPEEVIRVEVRNRVSVTDGEVRAFYEANPEIFRVPSEFTVREIALLADESDPVAREAKRERAREARERLMQPDADLDAIVQEYSEAGTAASGGILGPAREGDLSPALEQAALTTEVGGVSEILEMPYGFHLVVVESRTDARMRTLEEVEEDVRLNLEQQKYVELLVDFLERARDESEWRVAEGYLDRMPDP